MVFIVGDSTECRAGFVEAIACDHSSSFLAVLTRPNGPPTPANAPADRMLELWSLQPSMRKIAFTRFTLHSDGSKFTTARIFWHKDRDSLAILCSNGDVAIFAIELVQAHVAGQPAQVWWVQYGGTRTIGTATEAKQTLRLRKWCCLPLNGKAMTTGNADTALFVAVGSSIMELDWMGNWKACVQCAATFTKLHKWDGVHPVALYPSEAVMFDDHEPLSPIEAASAQLNNDDHHTVTNPHELPQCSKIIWSEPYRTMVALYHQTVQNTVRAFVAVWSFLGNGSNLVGMFCVPDGWSVFDMVQNEVMYASNGVQVLLCCRGTEEGSTAEQLYTLGLAISAQNLTADEPEIYVECKGKTRLHNATKAVNFQIAPSSELERIDMQLHETTAAADMAACFALQIGEPSTELDLCFTMLGSARSLICHSNMSHVGNTLRQYRIANRGISGLMPDGHSMLYCLQDSSVYYPDTETKEPYQDKFRRYKLPEPLRGSEILMGSSPSGRYIVCAADGHALHPKPHCDRLYVFSRATCRWRTINLANRVVDVTDADPERNRNSITTRTHRGRLTTDCAVVGVAWITDELLLVATRRRARYCLELVNRQIRDPRFAPNSQGSKADAQNTKVQDHVLTMLPPGYKPLFMHKVVESEDTVPETVTQHEGYARSCLVTVGDRTFVSVLRVVYDAKQMEKATGLGVSLGVIHAELAEREIPVNPRIEPLLEYDLEEAKQSEDGDRLSKRMALPASKVFILNGVEPTALAVLDGQGALFRVSVAANVAQFVMGGVLSVEAIDLPASGPRSLHPCFLLQTKSGERLWLPNLTPYDVTSPFHISERLSTTTLDSGAPLILGPAPASGAVLISQQQWKIHTTDEDVELSPTGAISCRPVSAMVRLIVHLLHCQLAQGGLKVRSASHTTFVHAVSRLITGLKTSPKGFLCFVEDLELFLHDMVEDDNFDSTEELYSILISILFSTNELLLLELLCRVGRKTEPHISAKLFPLPARDVIPVPKRVERTASAPVNRTMEVPPVGRRVRRADITGMYRRAHRSPWTPYRLFELCISAHNLYHAIRLLSLAWQDGTYVEEGSDIAIIRTYTLSLELLYHSLLHCNVRCAVQCWGFAYRMESVLKKEMLLPLSNEISSVDVLALSPQLVTYRRKVFREGADISNLMSSPKLGSGNVNPVSWLVTSTGSLGWGVASTLDSAIQGARSLLQFPQLDSDPNAEVVDPSEAYADILSPTLLLSLKMMYGLLKDDAYYPCAVFAQSICVTVEQFPSHLTSELLLLDTLHDLVGNEAVDVSETPLLESSVLTVHNGLKKLAEAFQLYNFTLFNFETKFRRLEQPEFIIHEECRRSMIEHRGHLMLQPVRGDASLGRPPLERKASTESFEVTSLMSAPDFESVLGSTSALPRRNVPTDHFDIPAGMNFTVESMLQWLCRIALLVGSLPTAAFLALLLGDIDTLSMSLGLFMLASMKHNGDHGMSEAVFHEINTRAKICARAMMVSVDRTDAEPSSNEQIIQAASNIVASSDATELPRRLSSRVLSTIAQVTSRAGSVRHIRDVIDLVCGIVSEPLVVAPLVAPPSPRPENA